MRGERTSMLTTAATFGLAIGGPITLISGLVTFATIPRGIPPALVVIFLVAGAVTTLSALVYLAERARDPS